MDERGFVLVVGSINLDLVVTVERLPIPGETVSGGTFDRHHGGKGANQAVAAARAGAQVKFVGAVGDDEFGEEAVDALISEGIDVAGVTFLAKRSTGVASIVVDVAGENQIAVAPGANAALNEAFVQRALDGVALPSGGVLLTNLEIRDNAILSAARLVGEAGMRVIVNPAPARPLSDEMISLKPILVPNESEARFLAGVDDRDESAVRVQERTDAPVLMTCGAHGAILSTDDGLRHISGYRVAAVDTTGAGDTVCGVLAAELAHGMTLDEASGRAMAAAALSVRGRGARTSMPFRGEVDAFLNQRSRG